MNERKTSFWKTPAGFAALGLIAAVSYFLLVEHRQHVWQLLPYFILLACPFMHIFMHGCHGSHNEQPDVKSEQDAYQRGLEDGRKEHEHHH